MADAKPRKPQAAGRQSATDKARMRKYAEDALDMLFDLAGGAESEAVRVSAIKELLDRGFGKSSSLIGPDSPPVLTRIERVIVHTKN